MTRRSGHKPAPAGKGQHATDSHQARHSKTRQANRGSNGSPPRGPAPSAPVPPPNYADAAYTSTDKTYRQAGGKSFDNTNTGKKRQNTPPTTHNTHVRSPVAGPAPSQSAGAGIVGPRKPEKKRSSIVQRNSLIVTGTGEEGEAWYKMLKREFTSASGELVVDRYWRGAIVSKAQKRRKAEAEGEEPKASKNNTRHSFRHVPTAGSFRVLDRDTKKFGYFHITHEIEVGSSIFTNCVVVGVWPEQSNPAIKATRVAKKEKKRQSTSSDRSSTRSDDANAYHWEVSLVSKDGAQAPANIEITEDKGASDLSSEKVLRLNGFCRIRSFSDSHFELCYHRHFPHDGHCHMDEGLPQPADVRFWNRYNITPPPRVEKATKSGFKESVNSKAAMKHCNDGNRYNDSYFDSKLWNQPPEKSADTSVYRRDGKRREPRGSAGYRSPEAAASSRRDGDNVNNRRRNKEKGGKGSRGLDYYNSTPPGYAMGMYPPALPGMIPVGSQRFSPLPRGVASSNASSVMYMPAPAYLVSAPGRFDGAHYHPLSYSSQAPPQMFYSNPTYMPHSRNFAEDFGHDDDEELLDPIYLPPAMPPRMLNRYH